MLQHRAILHYFLLPNNTPLYGYIGWPKSSFGFFHNIMQENLNELFGPCYILFIHSLVGGHLVCFYVLDIVNNATMNILVQVFV